MTTIINNPGDGEEPNSVFGILMGIIMLFVIVGIFIVYILPMMQNSQTAETTDINVNITTPIEEGNTP